MGGQLEEEAMLGLSVWFVLSVTAVDTDSSFLARFPAPAIICGLDGEIKRVCLVTVCVCAQFCLPVWCAHTVSQS